MKEKLKTYIGSSMRLAPMSFLVGCGFQSNNDDEILFGTFQSLPIPLMQTLTGENQLVTYYNKILKNNQDFSKLLKFVIRILWKKDLFFAKNQEVSRWKKMIF
ncbi:hypothetical protein [Mesomycoplasma ovipneumoniae]|uniref:hypothetical protein n=1 Tax=Mesomycoplasma ovipneumoniae TaxID=29562 RepID=UPI002963F2E8|nr:hypothetical protein [Mesomycoplasma ovipneumoniae]MDW2891215.1 hypothetical protein [Mesomycoplasma ovipneumoniae]